MTYAFDVIPEGTEEETKKEKEAETETYEERVTGGLTSVDEEE